MIPDIFILTAQDVHVMLDLVQSQFEEIRDKAKELMEKIVNDS